MPEQSPSQRKNSAGPWTWFPEFLFLRQRRVRNQVRLLGLAVLVGIVAGLGAILFYAATRGVEHYALGELAGYHPPVRPAGETEIPGLVSWNQPFRPWLLLVIPTVGRHPQRLAGLYLRPRGGRPWDGCRHRRLPQSSRANPPAGAPGQDRVQRANHRQRRIGRPRRADRTNRRRFRIAPGEPLEARRQRPPHSGGGGNGRRNCRHLPRPFGGRLVCRGSALLLSGVRTGSDHARSDCQCRFVLHLRALCRLEAALRDARSFLYESLGVGAVFAAGAFHDPSGHVVYPHVLRHDAFVPAAIVAAPFSARDRSFSDGSGGLPAVLRVRPETRPFSPFWRSATARSSKP